MPGLEPGIHVFLCLYPGKTWMAGRKGVHARARRQQYLEVRRMTVRVAINGFGRIGRNILRAIAESGRRDIEVVAHQRSRPGRNQRASAALRLGAWPLPRHRDGRGRLDQPRQRQDQGLRRARSFQAAVERPRRRHRARMHRPVHRQGQGLGAPDRWRQARADLGARRRRRYDGRLRRQSRQADEGAHGRLERRHARRTASRRSPRCSTTRSASRPAS